MYTTQTATGASSENVPFTPFQESYTFEAEPSTLERFEPAPASTPFVSEYAGVQTQTPESAELRDLLFELYDQEFDEVLAELADEAWQAVDQRAAPFGEANGTEAERFLQEWSQPVQMAAERMLDEAAAVVSEHDLASMSEAEVDALFERLEPRDTGLEAHFEHFLGGLLKKVKRLASKAVDVAKKGLTLIPGVGFLINRLKGLVKPLLDRVLKVAIDKLPATLQPLARQLAQRLLGMTAGELEGDVFEAAPAAPDVAAVQRQFDFEAATLMFAPDAAEQEAVVNEAVYQSERDDPAAVAHLHAARERFVDELEAGADPEQAMEQFIPAVMAILPIARTVLGIIGRKRVVETLARFLAGYISRYLPKDAASQLSTAIVDAGLRLLSLEAPAEDSRLATETLAHAVEDTVRRVTELDETVFEEPALLEAAMNEAFHAAAAENFPPQLLLAELHEAPLKATWVPMPRARKRNVYKKYTHIFEIEITPQMADAVTTFGGAKLAAVLKDQLGVTPPARARVHLYQAIVGTTLRRIARLERAVPGLGAAPHGAAQLHPLSVAAAGTLLGHPRLGRDVPGAFASSRRMIAAGERFYFLEIAGARPVTAAAAAGAAVRRTSDVNLTLDFPKDIFRVFLYLSEPDAQRLAADIRKRDLTAVLLHAKQVYDHGIRTALSGDLHGHVKIVTNAVAHEQFLGGMLKQLTEVVKQRLAQAVAGWVGKAVADYVGAGAGEFVAATEDPADGVTIVIEIANPPGAPLVRRLLRGEGIDAGALSDVQSLFKGQPRLSAKTVAGFRFD